jgi:TRAP transporter TAXI family solute receptor
MRSARKQPFAASSPARPFSRTRHRHLLAQVGAALAAAFLLLAGLQASAQPRPEGAAPTSPSLNAARANAGTLGIISGGADGTYIRIAADLANVLDNEDLRILPIIGRGSLQNLRDIMFLRGVDIGIVQMDALEGLRSEGLQDRAIQRLRYIARLYNEEVHVLAKREITDIRQLEGKKVNIDKPGSGTNMTARIIFEKLKVKPEFTAVDQAAAFEQLRNGTVDAALYVAGRPVRVISEFQGDGRFHLLSIPYDGEIAETYLPSRFTDADYPRLVDSGQTVDTLAVGSVLAVFNWPLGSDRYRRVERFVNTFFSNFENFQKAGRHPKWKEVNLSATVPGWERARPAQEWLDRQGAQEGDQPRDFEAFITSRGADISPAQREVLFREFLAWQRDRARARTSAGANP